MSAAVAPEAPRSDGAALAFWAGVVALALWLGLLGTWLWRFAQGGRLVLVAGLAALLPFAWPLMTSMSLFTTWNAVLWWQAMALFLACTPMRGAAGPPLRP